MTYAGWPLLNQRLLKIKDTQSSQQWHTVCANWSTTMDRSQMSRNTLLEPQNKTAYYTGLLCIPKVRIWGFVWEHTKSSLDFQDNTIYSSLHQFLLECTAEERTCCVPLLSHTLSPSNINLSYCYCKLIKSKFMKNTLVKIVIFNLSATEN